MSKLILLLLVLCCCIVGSTSTAVARAAQLQILTSFPPQFYEPFIAKFQELHPQIKLSVLNKKTTSAVAEILRGNKRNFDIFWSSSSDAFEIVKQASALRRTGLQRRYEAVSVDGFAVDDPDGYYYSFALSGVGWMWNTAYLEKEKLKIPSNWEQLATPAYSNHVVMSTPSRSGTTHLIVESLLQKMGWKEGWTYLMRLSGNLVTLSARSFSVAEGVKRGQFGLGLVIDILGRSSKTDTIDFRYGEPVLLCTAAVGALNNSPNTTEAELFIDFLLSTAGQELLLNPNVNRLPVAKDMYAGGDLAQSALFRLIKAGKSKAYDAYLSQLRYNLVNRLFDEMITFTLLERRQVWKRLRTLEEASLAGQNEKRVRAIERVKDEVYRLLSEIPVTEKQSRNPAYNAKFLTPQTGTPMSSELQQEFALWQQFQTKQLKAANALLDTVRTK